MKLHNDRNLFKSIILQTEAISKLTADIIEKDYYVTLMLKELADKQGEVKAYFKGGTALYKAIGRVKRFSEDIDITVDVEGLSINQARKRLEAAVYGYSLALNKQDDRYSERKGSITVVYDYESAFFAYAKEELQRFEKVLIEATSFTVSEPVTRYAIAPLLYNLTTETNKKILREQFDVAPFEIETIKLERIFIDKMFATEFYFERQSWFDVAKHVYDLTVLSGVESVKELLLDKEKLVEVISLKRREETIRKGGVSSKLKIIDFAYFDRLAGNNDFKSAYQNMQNKYVLNAADTIPLSTAISSIQNLKENFAAADC